MEHYLKYYKEIESNGHVWRLEIHQESDATFIVQEIGPVVQSIKLIVQGDQADIDTPIIKTSMEMVFVDAPDYEEDRKCGYWEEFYTSSSTEYKVILYKDGVKEWTGYITPDSFSESLQYRGSVTIIARDNLGTLQDISFNGGYLVNLDGKITVYNLLALAIQLSHCQLEYEYDQEEFPCAVGIDNLLLPIYNRLDYQHIDITAFDNENWWNVLEQVLSSCGLVLRYLGENRLRLMPLRNIPLLGNEHWADVPISNTKFIAYGQRELLPGIKAINEVDNFDYEIEPVNETIINYNDATAQVRCSDILFDCPNGVISNFNAIVYGHQDGRNQASILPEESNILNVGAYSKLEGESSEEYGQWDDKSIMYFVVNAVSPKPLKLYRNVYTTEASGLVSIRFTLGKPVSLLADYSAVCNTPISGASEYGQDATVLYRISHTANSIKYYYNALNAVWSENMVNNGISIPNGLFTTDKPTARPFELTDIKVPGPGLLTLEIVRVIITPLSLTLRQDCVGMYVRIKNIGIDVKLSESKEVSFLSKLTLNTEYSDKYSVRITRDPKLVAIPSNAPEVAYLPNTILTKCKTQYVGAENWIWPRYLDELPKSGILLSRLIHQQLLPYHAKPNNLLSGELATENPTFNSLYEWNGKLHILMSGALNLLTGRMENAMLREFDRYDYMWEISTNVDKVILAPGEHTFFIDIISPKGVSIKKEDIIGPSWMYVFNFSAMDNQNTRYRAYISASGVNYYRSDYIQIKTAFVKVIQTI